MKKLYRFEWDVGRMGMVEGLFISEEEVVDRIIGNRIYFGEILGKHSEVYGTLDKEDLTVLSEDQEFIAKMIEVFDGLNICGYNPLEYTDENEDEDG